MSKLLNSPSIDDFNSLKDEVIKGNKHQTNKLIDITLVDQDKGIYYLSLINQRFYKLIDILKIHKRGNIDDAINNIKPPIFWKDKQNIIEQAKVWDIKKIQFILKKLFDLEITFKSNANVNKNILLKKLLIDVCNLANS